jgi:hypothetical protein
MNKKLTSLFDLQKFHKNKQLENLIAQTHSRYNKEISEDDLSEISAAGDINLRANIHFKTAGDNND